MSRRRTISLLRKLAVVVVPCVALLVAITSAARPAGPPVYRSPLDILISPSGKQLFVSDFTHGSIVVLNAETGEKQDEWKLKGKPAGLAMTVDGERLFVVDRERGELLVLRAKDGKAVGKVSVGARPTAVCYDPKNQRLFVCNTASDDVSAIDVASGKEIKRLPAVREPAAAAVTPDGQTLVVVNSLPVGSADDEDIGADVNLYDAVSLEPKGSIKLTLGATNARGLAISQDGQWAYVTHTLARFNVPPTQLERGWVNTSALAIIDLAKQERLTTVLLDELDEGAADPFDMVLTPDGEQLRITLGGTHQLCLIDIAKLHELLDGKVPEELANRNKADYGTQNLWNEILNDRQRALDKLQNDLTALYQAGVRHRWKSHSNGPRGLALDLNGTQTFVAHYYGGAVTALDDRGRELWTAPVGKQPEETPERHGERLFFDAIVCFQHWQSCGSCHPSVRMDGLRWDLQNDGMGNPKKTRSLVMSHRTSPVMAMGVRADMETASAAGVRFILFAVIPDEDQEALDAYIRSLRPEPSPHLDAEGRLTPAARRGKQIFDGKAQCAECHFGEQYTDMVTYDVGTLGQYDREGHTFVTPKLIELYRTAPYLHDARTGSLKEVLTKYNAEDKHGKTTGLSDKELDDLVAYLLSL